MKSLKFEVRVDVTKVDTRTDGEAGTADLDVQEEFDDATWYVRRVASVVRSIRAERVDACSVQNA